MNTKAIAASVVALPLAVGGFVLANNQLQGTEKKSSVVADQGYTCPITGEKLGCPNCCPLNQSKAK